MKLIIILLILILGVSYFYLWYVRISPENGQFFVAKEYNVQCKTLASTIFSEIKQANYCQTDTDCTINNFGKNPFTCDALINRKEKLFLAGLQIFLYQQKKCPGYDEPLECNKPTPDQIVCQDKICKKTQ